MGTIAGPLTSVEPIQPVNSLDIDPAMLQHMQVPTLDLVLEMVYFC